MTTPYAYTRSREPSTGDVLMAPPPRANRWLPAAAPMAQVVAMTMRTQLGACAVDLGLGVNWRSIEKLSTGAAATARFVIEQGLARYVAAALITNVVVSAVVTGSRVEWDVAFTDPRTQTRPRITGTRSLS
jgi:hypothetical protein